MINLISKKAVYFFSAIGMIAIAATSIVSIFSSPTEIDSPAKPEILGASTGSEEFAGPFATWAKITDYGANGADSSDDSAAFQAAINDLGKDGKPSVLYVPAGNYLISSGLKLDGVRHIGIIGENPENTTLKWTGGYNGVLLTIDSVAYSRFKRFTYDGNGRAGVLIDQSFRGYGNYFDTQNEYTDSIFKNAGIGLRGGNSGYGFSETSIERSRFYNLTEAGIAVKNPNSLDLFVRDSYFENNRVGLTNTPGSGHFHVYSSTFVNSQRADMEITNPNTYYGIRDNFSIGAPYFFLANPIGSPSAAVTFQRNTIIEPKVRAFEFHNPGPVILIDNTVKSRPGFNGPEFTIEEAYTNNPATADMVALGNTFTVNNSYEVKGKKIVVDDRVVSASSISFSPPRPESFAPNYSRRIFEVPSGADSATIQNYINQAAQLTGQRPIVHLPTGEYNLSQTLTVPGGSDLQLIGDGGRTVLKWNGASDGAAIKFNSPAKATARDFYMYGNNKGTAIAADISDNSNSQVILNQVDSSHAREVGLLVSGVGQAKISGYSLYMNLNQTGIKIAGTGALGSSNLSMIGGLVSDSHGAYSVTDGGKLLVMDAWYEGANPDFVNLSGNSWLSINSGQVYTNDPNKGGNNREVPPFIFNNFTGRAFVSNIFIARGGIEIKGGGGGKILGLGIVGPALTEDYFLNTTASQSALVLSRRQNRDASTSMVSDKLSSVGDINSFVREMFEPLRAGAVSVSTATDLRITKVISEYFNRGYVFTAASADSPPAPNPAPPAPNPPPGPTPSNSVSVTGSLITEISLSKTRNNYSGWTGTKILIGSKPLTVTHLGRMFVEGNNQTHKLKLISINGTDLPGGAASLSFSAKKPNQFEYVQLSQPVELATNTSYYLVAQEFAGGDKFYDWDNIIKTTDAASLTASVYWNQVNKYEEVAVGGSGYGPVDLKYNKTDKDNAKNESTGQEAVVYPVVDLVKNVSLRITYQAIKFENGKWKYEISWNRTLKRDASIYINNVEVRAAATASGKAEILLSPGQRIKMEFYSLPNKKGFPLARKYFFALPAQ